MDGLKSLWLSHNKKELKDNDFVYRVILNQENIRQDKCPELTTLEKYSGSQEYDNKTHDSKTLRDIITGEKFLTKYQSDN
jgi:hypothetical protein